MEHDFRVKASEKMDKSAIQKLSPALKEELQGILLREKVQLEIGALLEM